jgi:hypothetical protein
MGCVQSSVECVEPERVAFCRRSQGAPGSSRRAHVSGALELPWGEGKWVGWIYSSAARCRGCSSCTWLICFQVCRWLGLPGYDSILLNLSPPFPPPELVTS